MKRMSKKQKGFTIIELVVVILLLGILTATALPRFMDVTTEAHAAVRNGVQSGLSTGLGLFRATWYARRQPLTSGLTDWATLFANSAGYPIGANAALTDAPDLNGVDCKTIYDTLLQAGRPEAIAISYNATPATLETSIEGIASTAQFAISNAALVTNTGCVLYYVGQNRSGTAAANATIQTITYTFATGVITTGTLVLDQG